MKNYAVVLAAGYGTRMKSKQQKCLYPILRKPMIEYIIETLQNITCIDEIIMIIKYKKNDLISLLGEKVNFIEQSDGYGTGAAAKAAISQIQDEGYTIIIPGDKPLINNKIINKIIDTHLKENNALTIATTIDYHNHHYGKIIRDEVGKIIKIVEYKNATTLQKGMIELNTSVYCINNKYYKHLVSLLDTIDQECLLTDIVYQAYKNQLKIGSCFISEFQRFYGVNDFYDLSEIENFIRMETNKKFMQQGICIINPQTVTISSEVQIEPETIINPNTYLTGNTIIKSKSVIGPNTEIHNSFIGEGSVVKHSLIYDSHIADNCMIGPFAHLRASTTLHDNIRIGNFVEVKASEIFDGTKASHLTYIGDSKVGKNVNFGCGSITVNYDGKHKYHTIIGDNVFIGCNSNLIAPLEINDGAFIAAGSTITTNVPKDSLSIARSYQITKEGYAVKYPYAQKFKKDEDN